jgi:hypothetical protein
VNCFLQHGKGSIEEKVLLGAVHAKPDGSVALYATARLIQVDPDWLFNSVCLDKTDTLV